MEAEERLALTSTPGAAVDLHQSSAPATPQESFRGRLRAFERADAGQQHQQQQQQQQQQHSVMESSISQLSSTTWQPPYIPQTLALLLFRNADRLHAGETCFLPRWPLPSLRDLLEACGRACTPVVGPVESLLTTDLQLVRSLQEVKTGSVYLLKGHERLAPPLLFLDHPESQRLAKSASVPSLRSLSLSRRKMQADREFCCLHPPTPSGEKSHDSSYPREKEHQSNQGANVLAADSPLRKAAHRALSRRWQPERQLGMTLSWGGLGQAPRHHDFWNWEPALRDCKGGRKEQKPAMTS